MSLLVQPVTPAPVKQPPSCLGSAASHPGHHPRPPYGPGDIHSWPPVSDTTFADHFHLQHHPFAWQTVLGLARVARQNHPPPPPPRECPAPPPAALMNQTRAGSSTGSLQNLSGDSNARLGLRILWSFPHTIVVQTALLCLGSRHLCHPLVMWPWPSQAPSGCCGLLI